MSERQIHTDANHFGEQHDQPRPITRIKEWLAYQDIDPYGESREERLARVRHCLRVVVGHRLDEAAKAQRETRMRFLSLRDLQMSLDLLANLTFSERVWEDGVANPRPIPESDLPPLSVVIKLP